MNNYMQSNGTSLYGNYRARTFSEIFESENKFLEEWNKTPFSAATATETNFQENFNLIFYLLYSRYGNSTIASSDENQFRYKLFGLMFQYGPTWAKELQIQKELRSKNVEEFQMGTKNIVNNAQNPSSAPSTSTLEELLYINQQNTSTTKRSLADGYALMLSLLKEDVTETFIKRFQKLFLTIVAPELPLWYANHPEEE